MKTEYKTVKVEVKNGVAILALNNPPVNQLSEHFVREMADALIKAGADNSIKAVILTGTGKNFIAGADITEIQGVKDKNFLLPRVMENHRFINAIEDAPKPVEVVQNYLREKGVSPKEVTSDEIVDQMLARAINEAAYMIQEGICDRPQDMDLAMVYGTGFPPYRGGILRYADAWGIGNVYQHLVKLEKEHGVRFKSCNLLKEMAEQGKTFYKM